MPLVQEQALNLPWKLHPLPCDGYTSPLCPGAKPETRVLFAISSPNIRRLLSLTASSPLAHGRGRPTGPLPLQWVLP